MRVQNNKWTGSFQKLAVLGFVLMLNFVTGVAQERNKRDIKREQKALEKQERINATENLISSKTFVFNADMALPNGMPNISLATNSNFLEFTPDFIESDMPFFGRAFSGVAFGGDQGIHFKGVPKSYEVEKHQNKYDIYAEVKDSNDNYRIYLTVGPEGNATLNILSNNRSPMTYQGQVYEVVNINKKEV